ncbi:hypothetical protein LguiB_006392 [Lonicera macranthoides]
MDSFSEDMGARYLRIQLCTVPTSSSVHRSDLDLDLDESFSREMQETKTFFVEEIVITYLVIEDWKSQNQLRRINKSNNLKLDTAQDVNEEQSNVNVTADDAKTYLVPNEVQEQFNGNVSDDDAETYPASTK